MKFVSGIFACLLGFYLCVTISTQIKLPRHPVGFEYSPTSHTPSSSNIVTLKVFLDNMCTDSLYAFENLLKIMPRYCKRGVTLTVVLFPLPFLKNSFEFVKAAYAVNSLNSSLTYTWISTVYNNIKKFSRASTINDTDADIVSKIVKLATQVGLDGDKFLARYNSRKVEIKARTSFKYGCLRGVADTPTYLVNDIPVLIGTNNYAESNISRVIAELISPKKQSGNG